MMKIWAESVAPLSSGDSVFCLADDFFIRLRLGLTDHVKLQYAAFFPVSKFLIVAYGAIAAVS
jgi:hypothetical protein